MKLLQAKLDEVRAGKEPAIMAHLVLGYPSLTESVKLAKILARAGADFLELQIPFSDPIADGPTIMAANEAALRRGATPQKCMKAAEAICAGVEIPALIMTYYNIALSFPGGLRGFMQRCKKAGIQGLIIPDVPPEESQERYWELAPKYSLAAIPLVSPLTSSKRVKIISSAARHGFVYCVARTGTTGASRGLGSGLAAYLRRMRKEFALPLAVGFGISTRRQVAAVGRAAEIAIVGSATLDAMKSAKARSALTAAGRFIAGLKR